MRLVVNRALEEPVVLMASTSQNINRNTNQSQSTSLSIRRSTQQNTTPQRRQRGTRLSGTETQWSMRTPIQLPYRLPLNTLTRIRTFPSTIPTLRYPTSHSIHPRSNQFRPRHRCPTTTTRFRATPIIRRSHTGIPRRSRTDPTCHTSITGRHTPPNTTSRLRRTQRPTPRHTQLQQRRTPPQLTPPHRTQQRPHTPLHTRSQSMRNPNTKSQNMKSQSTKNQNTRKELRIYL